jgi:RNA polymerase sigma-70 factor (ECF subfamily)
MDTQTFKNKILSLSDRIFPMVARMLGSNTEAEDAVQEIMIKLWTRRKEVGKHPNIPGFVFLTARNFCLDQLKKRNIDLSDSSLSNTVIESETGQEQLEWKELKKLVDGILVLLPDQQRDIMLMRDIDGLEYSEIASVMQLKVEHVRVLLSRARKKVGNELKKIYCYEQGEN